MLVILHRKLLTTACTRNIHLNFPRVRINDHYVRTIPSIIRATLYLPEIELIAFIKRRCA